MLNRVSLLALLFLLSGTACSDQAVSTAYKLEADALCNAFNPSTWGVDFQKLTPSEKATMLQNKIQAALQSDEMTKIYQTLITVSPDKAYSNYVTAVSALIGEPHSCPSIKDYFSF